MFWGIGAGIAVSLFMSPVPIFQKDVLDRFPIVRTVARLASSSYGLCPKPLEMGFMELVVRVQADLLPSLDYSNRSATSSSVSWNEACR